MKRLVLIGILFLMTIVVLGQSKWDGFFRPVTTGNTPAFREATRVHWKRTRGNGTSQCTGLFRPTVGLSVAYSLQVRKRKHSVSFVQ